MYMMIMNTLFFVIIRRCACLRCCIVINCSGIIFIVRILVCNFGAHFQYLSYIHIRNPRRLPCSCDENAYSYIPHDFASFTSVIIH
eukprot:UN05947